jgi:hypothetical protein
MDLGSEGNDEVVSSGEKGATPPWVGTGKKPMDYALELVHGSAREVG